MLALRKHIIEFKSINDRTAYLRIKNEKQEFIDNKRDAPTENATEEEKGNLYEEIEKLHDDIPGKM